MAICEFPGVYQKSAIFKRSHLFQTIAGTIWCKPWDVQNNLHNVTLILSSRMNVFNTKFFDTNSEWTSRWCKHQTTDYPHVIQRHRKCIKHLQPIFGYPKLLFGGVWLWGFASFTQSLATNEIVICFSTSSSNWKPWLHHGYKKDLEDVYFLEHQDFFKLQAMQVYPLVN